MTRPAMWREATPGEAVAAAVAAASESRLQQQRQQATSSRQAARPQARRSKCPRRAGRRPPRCTPQSPAHATPRRRAAPPPLAQALETPGEFLLSDFSKFDRPPLLHLAFQALDAFQVGPCAGRAARRAAAPHARLPRQLGGAPSRGRQRARSLPM
jgi:hypothetical protein